MDKLKEKIKAMIRKSESIFKTDMIYVVKNGSWSAFGQIMSVLVSFLLTYAYAHFLTKESYCDYKFILSITTVIGALSLSGIGTAIIQAIAQGKERVFHDGIKVTLRWGLIVTVASFVMSAYYFFSGNPTVGFALIIFGICAPLSNAYGLYGSLFIGKKDFKKSTLVATLSQIISTLIIICTVIFYPNVLFLVAVSFISTAVISYLFYRYVIRKYPLNDVGDDSMINYGKHLSFMNFFGNLANQLDKILVFHWMGAAQLAVYSFATIIPEQIRNSYKNIFGIALPKFSGLSGQALKKSILDKTVKLSIISLVIVLAYDIVVPYFFDIFFPKYLSSVWYSQIYMTGLVAIPGMALFGTYFQVLKDTKTLYKMTMIGNIVTIIYSFALICSAQELAIRSFLILERILRSLVFLTPNANRRE